MSGSLPCFFNFQYNSHCVTQFHFSLQLDSKEQLKKVAQMKLYNYKFSDDFANAMGIPEDSREDTGVIAQEIREVLPEAVKEAGDVPLGNGEVIKDFLVVNKVIIRVSHFRGGWGVTDDVVVMGFGFLEDMLL